MEIVYSPDARPRNYKQKRLPARWRRLVHASTPTGSVAEQAPPKVVYGIVNAQQMGALFGELKNDTAREMRVKKREWARGAHGKGAE